MAELDDAAARVKKAAKKLAAFAQNRQDMADKIAALQVQLATLDQQQDAWLAEYNQAKTDLAGLAETL